MFAEHISSSALICKHCIYLHSIAAEPMPPLQDPSTAAARMPPLQEPDSSSFAPKQKASAPTKAPKKKKDDELYSHFTIVDLPGNKVSVACNHCTKFNKPSIARFNPTHARHHIINVCKGVDREVKRIADNGKQSVRRMAREYALASGPTETMSEMCAAAIQKTSDRMNATPRPHSKEVVNLTDSPLPSVTPVAKGRGTTIQPKLLSHPSFTNVMTKAEADKIITAEVKAILARGEPLSRLLDDHVRAGLYTRHPRLAEGTFLPHDTKTIYDNYVVPIDKQAYEELRTLIQRRPGEINIGMDGATINGKQKVSYMTYI
jgi:hypothetical protein